MKLYSYTIKSKLIIWLFPLGLILLICINTACKKQDEWLDKKRANNEVIPSSLKDLQAVLDNTIIMNQNYAQLGLVSSDNNVVTDVNLTAASQTERSAYLWEKNVFYTPTSSFNWQYAYQIIECANIVLDGLEKNVQNNSNQMNHNNVKGSALFYRAMGFYQLAQLFCKPYIKASAVTDLGIPIRLTSDVNIPSVRATVQQTYDQILSDLQSAVALLPVTPLYATRPSSVAANALLAKIYLSMEDYPKAGGYADLVLEKFPTLLDFKSSSVSTALPYRFPVFSVGNPEIIFYASAASYSTVSNRTSGTGTVDPVLYASYSSNDLRKPILYQDYGAGKIKFQGSYTGVALNFSGIATNEIYLIRAECYARAGNKDLAMADLNTLLKQRFASPYTDLTAIDADDALVKILNERQKELPYTGQLRWEDLRRLNKDPRFAKTLQRTYNGDTYTLLPNDKRYVFPIPDLEVQMYGLPQNER